MAASAAVVDENKIYGEFYTDFKLKHSEKIMFLIEGVLTNLRMSLNDIDLIACGKGPGSFTGLRIGAGTAKAIAHGKGLKIAGISSLKACAYQNRIYGGEICAIFDAQQQSLYCGIYKNSANGFLSVMQDRVIPIDELIYLLKERKSDILFCGDAVKKYTEKISDALKGHAVFATENLLMPHAYSVGELAALITEEDYSDYNTFLPEYIRKSQAEEKHSVNQ